MGLITFIIKWAFIIFVTLLLIGVGLGIYFYYFHVFKTIRICVPEQSSDLNISCTSNQQCLDLFKANDGRTQNNNLANMDSQLANTPDFMKPAITTTINQVLYCDSTCRLRMMSQDAIRGIDQPAVCNAGEFETAKVDLHGKELIQFLKYMKNKVTS